MKLEERLKMGAEDTIAELRADNERLRTFLCHVAGALAVFGPDCKIVWTNEETDANFGMPFPGSGKYCYEVLPKTAERCDPCPVRRAFETAQVESAEMRIMLPTGDERWYLGTATPAFDAEGKVIQVIVLAQDVTERLRIKRELQKQARMLEAQNRKIALASSQKNRFFASMSHELRSPMTSIVGFTELLLEDTDDPLSPDQQSLLRKVGRNAEHLLAMINDLLDLSKIESGRMTVHLASVDLAALVEHVMGTMKPLAAAQDVMLSAELAEHLPKMSTDEQKLSQILINLLSNAIKFTPKGRVTVKGDLVGGKIRLSVADTGIGIRRSEFGKIFEEFWQSGAGIARKDGTGLGLAITRRLASLLGGDIKVSSKLGQGSTFTVTLPVSHSHATS